MKKIIVFIYNALIGRLIIAHKIRIISTGYILYSTLLALFLAAHYGFFNLVNLWRNPAALAQILQFSDPTIEIPSSSRSFIVILDILPCVPSLFALNFGARVMASFRSERYFTVNITRSISHDGLSVIAFALLKLFSLNVIIPYVFRYDPKADIPVRFIFEPTDAGFLLIG